MSTVVTGCGWKTMLSGRPWTGWRSTLRGGGCREYSKLLSPMTSMHSSWKISSLSFRAYNDNLKRRTRIMDSSIPMHRSPMITMAETSFSTLSSPLIGPKVPNMDIARSMPLTFSELDNGTLITLGRMGDHEAHIEILKRHIMVVDNVSYEEANQTFLEIAKKNEEGKYLLTVPYRIGIYTALAAGFASFPLVFHLSTAEWFNQYYVTTDLPSAEDLETWLEVGAWTWNWMEPPLGQISFFLLCLQYSRSQFLNMGIRPYTETIKRWRGQHLSENFPRYDPHVISNYSESSKLVGEKARDKI